MLGGNKILIVCACWIGCLVTVIGRVTDTVLCRACHIVVDWSMAVFVFYAFFYACTWNINFHQNKFKQKYVLQFTDWKKVQESVEHYKFIMFNHPWSRFEIQYLNLSLIGINAAASMIICIPFIDHPTTIAKL